MPTLADFSCEVASRLGLPRRSLSPVSIPDASRYVLVLVDGLGWDITMRAIPQAPYIAGLIGDATRLITGMPTTTAASLMSVWTGELPGVHGVVGFSFCSNPRRRAQDLVMALSIPDRLDSADSLMDKLQLSGVEVTFVVPQEHIGTGLTQTATRLATMVGADLRAQDSRINQIVAASRRGSKSLVYVYEGSLDKAGHRHGVSSWMWIDALGKIDRFLEDLREHLDDDVCLLVTGDHGMVDIDEDDRVDIRAEKSLRAEVDLVGGEARFRHLYTNQPQAVARRWKDRLGENAAVFTNQEAIEADLFGRVDPRWGSRIGDVVVMPTSGQAYLHPSFPGEYQLVGMHGAATPAERVVPLLIDPGWQE